MPQRLRTPLATRPRRQIWEFVAVATLYGLYALWLTWPMPLDARTAVYGPGGDVIGALTQFRELAQHAVPFLPGSIESLGAPEGQPVRYPLYVATWPSSLWIWASSLLLGAVPAWNLFVMAGFVLTGVATYAFVYWRTGSSAPSAIAGWAFAFHPDAVFNAGTAPDFMHRWILLLLLWRSFVLRDAPTRRNALGAALAAIIAVSWNPYFLLMVTVALVVLGTSHLVAALRRSNLRVGLVTLAWWTAPLLVTAAVYGTVAATAPAGTSGVRERSLADLTLYSLRPGEYLNPHEGALLFGWLTFPGSRPDSSTYVYVGLVTTALALVAIGLALRKRLHVPAGDVWTIVALVATALVWSGPPVANVAGISFYLPSYFVAQITTTWRVYGRFGVFVELGVVLLAAFALASLIKGRSSLMRSAVSAVVAVLVALDLYGSPLPVTKIQNPPIYSVLRDLPPGAVAEYPIVPSVFGAYDQLQRQDAHRKPLLNGFEPGSPAEVRALRLATLSDKTIERLRALGIRYVMVDTQYPLSPDQPAPGPISEQLRFLQADRGFALYEVPGVGTGTSVR